MVESKRAMLACENIADIYCAYCFLNFLIAVNRGSNYICMTSNILGLYSLLLLLMILPGTWIGMRISSQNVFFFVISLSEKFKQ